MWPRPWAACWWSASGGLPLQRIGLRLQLVCETSQAATDLIVGQQLTGKLPRVVGLRSKLRSGLMRGRFVRHDETSIHLRQTDDAPYGGAIRTISQSSGSEKFACRHKL
jgi:hypothetical protein